jgi:P27 family predicted phage terminase small subunit
MQGRKPRLAVVTDQPQKSPPAPASLGPIGRAEWRKVAPILANAGHLPPETESLLVCYCEAIEAAHDAAKTLKKQGRTIPGPNGTAKAHPMVRAQVTYLQTALRYANDLGITATARARASKTPRGSSPSLVD